MVKKTILILLALVPNLAFAQNAKVIEFYIPTKYCKKAMKWINPEDRGKVIYFPEPKSQGTIPTAPGNPPASNQ